MTPTAWGTAPDGQTALFHLLNLAHAHGAEVLMAARAPVRDWGVTLPDLASRLGHPCRRRRAR